jgi:hypothetical protein
MSLCCLYEGCNRTFTKQQGLTQHIQYHHPFVENKQEEIQNTVSDNDAVLFQDEKVFEELDLFKRKLPQVESINFNNVEVSFRNT